MGKSIELKEKCKCETRKEQKVRTEGMKKRTKGKCKSEKRKGRKNGRNEGENKGEI